jgi:hypothetical protein
MTDDVKRKLTSFFETYAEHMNNALGERPVVDVNAVAGQFADYFVEASPVGVQGGSNGDDFRAVIPRGYEFYRKIGTQSMKIDVRDVTQLDDFHWMVKVHWTAEYLTRAETREVIDFDVIYFLQFLDDDRTPRIFAYITGDEQRILRERGLIDPEAISEGVLG